MKKYIFLLVMIITVFFSFSFAVSNTDFENMAQAIVDQYGSGINDNSRKSAIYSWLTDIAYVDQRNFVLSYLEDYEYCNIISVADYSTDASTTYYFVNTVFMGWNESDDSYYYYDDGSNNVIMKCSNQISRVYFSGSTSHGSLAAGGLSYSHTTTIGVSNRVNRSSAVTSLDKPIYTNNSKTDIDTAWTSLYNFPPSEEEMEFIKESSINNITINLYGTNLTMPLYYKATDYSSVPLGYLYIPQNYEGINYYTLGLFYFDRTTNSWENYRQLLEVRLNQQNARSNNYLYFNYETFTKLITSLKSQYAYRDMIYLLTFAGKKEDTDVLTIANDYFYIGSSNTLIGSGGVINNDFLRSGDYANEYNQNIPGMIQDIDDGIQNQNISSDINDVLTDMSNFGNIGAEFASGDMSDKLGYQELDNPFYGDIFAWRTQIINAFNISYEDPYFDFSLHGESSHRIYASQFTVPEGYIKTFVQMFLVAGICIVMSLSFYHTIINLQQLDFKKLKDNKIDNLDFLRM